MHTPFDQFDWMILSSLRFARDISSKKAAKAAQPSFDC
jgi:hypothetical protein